MDPYLPDIIQGVVERVSAAFQARATDPFTVFFEKGLYTQVAKSVYKEQNHNNYPLIWYVMPEVIIRDDWSVYGHSDFDLYLIMPTDNTFTQQQRDDLSFKPRLVPIYNVLMEEVGREGWFKLGYTIDHKKTLLPYWGGADVGATDTKNLFKKNVDAIRVRFSKIGIRNENCRAAGYPVNPNTNYQPSPYILAFFDDLELIVGGSGENDPVVDSTAVSIPSLAGMSFDVEQRGFGTLRKSVNVEWVKDENGGFMLTGGRKFAVNDTYIVKVRPQYVENTLGYTGAFRQGLTSVFIENN